MKKKSFKSFFSCKITHNTGRDRCLILFITLSAYIISVNSSEVSQISPRFSNSWKNINVTKQHWCWGTLFINYQLIGVLHQHNPWRSPGWSCDSHGENELCCNCGRINSGKTRWPSDEQKGEENEQVEITGLASVGLIRTVPGSLAT